MYNCYLLYLFHFFESLLLLMLCIFPIIDFYNVHIYVNADIKRFWNALIVVGHGSKSQFILLHIFCILYGSPKINQ